MQTVITDVLINPQISDTQTVKETKSSVSPSISFQNLVNSANENNQSVLNAAGESFSKAESVSQADKSQNEAIKHESESEKTDKKDIVKEKDKNEVDASKNDVKEADVPSKETEEASESELKNQLKKNQNKANQDKAGKFEEINIETFTQAPSLINKDIKSTALGSLDKSELKVSSKNTDSKKKSSGVAGLGKDLKTAKISVTDLRTKKVTEAENTKKPESKLNFNVKFNGDNTATVVMDYASNNAQNNMMSMNNQVAASEGSNFQAMLNNQIQENIPEFVKTGSIILKDNDQGTINLILHPEDLGNVKIHLSLDGKTVSGHIIVATKEALEVFKDNAQTLREAFEQNGFENASFNVSYNGSGEGSQNNFAGEFNSNDYVARQAYEFSGESSDVTDDFMAEINSEKKSEYSINIVA